MKKIAWLVKRLSVMRPNEIAHRVSEFVLIKWMHILYVCNMHQLYSKHIDFKKCTFCIAEVSQLPELEWELNMGESIEAKYISGSTDALGFCWSWKYEQDIWNRAPDTGHYWPKIFFSSISYRTGNPFGDIRIAWEPSRLQQLVDLSLIAENSTGKKSTDAVRMIEKQFISWQQENQLWNGIHYLSAMECALRILAVTYALDKVRGKLKNSDVIWHAYSLMIYQHAKMIANRLSLHSSSGNHTIAECAGLIYAGLLFPEFKDAKHWLETGLKIMNDEVDHQVLPDGGGVEQAFWYHLFIIDLLGLIVSLLSFKKKSVPEKLNKALNRGRSFLQALGDTPEKLFVVGDSDNGYALSKYLRITWGNTKPVKKSCVTSFIDAGYTLIEDSGEVNSQLLFDHGGLGMAPSFGHGHADALSVIININNEPMMIDPGTYTYTGDIDWRAYFRGTSAHNTVRIDDLDQSGQKSAFMWSRSIKSELLKVIDNVTDEYVMLLAKHEGYNKLGVTHTRGIFWRKNGRIVIWDCLTGDGDHKLELHWHLAVKAEAYKNDSIYINLSSRKYYMNVSGGTQSTLIGQTNPISGWKSGKYGVKEEITTLRYTYEGELPHEFMTIISPVDIDNNCYDDDIIQMRKWHYELSKN